MKKTFFLFSLLFAGCLSMFAQNEYVGKVFITESKDSLRYRELLPENFDSEAKYPLVLFLHGAGERGKDNKAQLSHGAMMFTNPLNREKYPAIVVYPQCPVDQFWPFDNIYKGKLDKDAFPANASISKPLKAVMELLNQYIASGNVDMGRIYVMGLSMGGMGAFDLACRYPDVFAAAVPICGGIHPDRLKAVAGKVKFRIFHGDKDDVVPVENSRMAYLALKKYGVKAEYTEFVGCNHESWNPAFNLPDFLPWLFIQKKD